MSSQPEPVNVEKILEQLRDSVRYHNQVGGAANGVQTPQGRQLNLLLNQVRRSSIINPQLPIAWPEWPPGLVPKIVALLKKVTRRLLRWYIDPIVEQQNAFNLAVLQTLQQMVILDHRIKRLEQQQGQKEETDSLKSTEIEGARDGQ